MSRWRFEVRSGVSKHSSQNDEVKDRIDKEELCSDPCPDDSFFRAIIFNACGDGECQRVLCVGADIVYRLTFDATSWLYHGLRVYGFAGLVLK